MYNREYKQARSTFGALAGRARRDSGMFNVTVAVALLSGLAIVVAVMLQKTKADGFSAAMGGSDSTRHTPGSKEEWLDKIAKFSAVVWVLACLATAILWYRR